MKNSVVLTLAAAFVMPALAVTDTFLPGNSSVNYAVCVDNFYVNSTGMDYYGTSSWASSYTYTGTNPLFGIQAGASSGSYSDAGIVLYFDGSLTLGQLASVTLSLAASDPGNATPIVNLWLDTGGNDAFFAFTGDLLTGLDGDAYFGAIAAGDIDGSTKFGYLGGPGSYGEYTLAQLQAGEREGIDANTKLALWIGITNGDYYNYNYANITQVDVGRIPEPATLVLLGLGGLVLRKVRA